MTAPFISGGGSSAHFKRAGLLRAQYSLVVLTLCALACFPLAARQAASTDGGAPSPAIRVDLVPLGYAGLSSGARLSGIANLSVDFLDEHHLLVTFNPKKLVQRLPECPPTHQDRLVHAVVLELPGGKVVKETDWYLHDTRRYVWPMGSGRFLLRKLNQLYEVDANLSERLALDSPKDLVWVSVTPDGKQIIAETIEQEIKGEKSKDEKPAADKAGSPTKAKVKLSFIDADLLSVQRVMESQGTVNLHATNSGFADVRESGTGVWLVRFGPGPRDRVNVTRVRARRVPNVMYGSANSLLVGRCANAGDAYVVSAFTVTGNFLWKQRWSECRYTPTVASSEDGSRFAIATVTPVSNKAKPNDEEEDPQNDGLIQTVKVMDTTNGATKLSIKASPAVLDGQNYALSPEGTQLALLEGQFLEIHKLPEMSADERTKYAAVKADVPAPYVPVATPESGKPNEAEEVIQLSSAQEEATPETAADSAKPEADGDATKTADATGTPPSSSAVPTQPPPAPTVAAHVAVPPLTLRASTQVVALDVVATDSKGHLVKGLQQSDFVVQEDGKPQSVRYMREYAGEAPASPKAEAPAKQIEIAPNIFSNATQPAEVGAVTVVVFDLLNTEVPDQAHAQAELIKFLKNKPKESQFALCILGTRIQMIQGFTQDRETLVTAARNRKASAHLQQIINSNGPLQSILDVGKATTQFLPELDFFSESLALQESEVRAMDADRRMYATVDSFAQLARYLSGLPGRKNLIWLSGSFSLGLSPDAGAQSPFVQVRNYADNLKKVTNLLAEAHVAVYPVDVKGLQTDPMFSASSNDQLAPISIQGATPLGPSASGGGIVFAGGRKNADTAIPVAMMQNQMSQFGLNEISERTTMDQLARETGGRAFYNTNGISKAIETANEEGENYYALSYTPTNKNYNGGFRKVKVSVAGKKLNLAYRTGYYAVDPYAAAKPAKDLKSNLAMAAMQYGSPQSRQVVFGARVAPVGKPRVLQDAAATSGKAAKKKRKGDTGPVEVQLYAMDYAVTANDLRLVPAVDGMYHGILNFMATSFDEDGKLGASQISQMAVDVKPDVFQNVLKTGLRLHQEVEVPVKSTALRLGVEDVATSHIGTLEIPLPVKPLPDAAVAKRPMPPIEKD